jgi:hypothetical protein
MAPTTWNRVILGFCALSVIGHGMLHHLFDYVASAHYSDGAQLAQCIGTIDVLIGVTQVLSMVLLSGRFLRQCGPYAGLLVVPLLLSLGATAMLVGWGLTEQPLAVLWIAALAKVGDNVFRASLQNPSLLMLYQELLCSARNRLRMAAETIVKPLSGVAADGLLILINNVLLWGLAARITATLAIGLAWSGAAVILLVASSRSHGCLRTWWPARHIRRTVCHITMSRRSR